MSYFCDIVLHAQLSAVVLLNALHFYFAPHIKSKDRADIRQHYVQKCLSYLGKVLRNDQSEGKHRIVVKRRIMDKSSESLADNFIGIGVAPDKLGVSREALRAGDEAERHVRRHM